MSTNKEYLFTPGPVYIPPRIFEAMAKSSMHHRTDVFKAVFESARSEYQNLTNSETPPIFFASSGSGAMEATLLNLCKSGDKIIYLNGGKFGERWGDIAKFLGLDAIEIKVANGETAEVNNIKEVLNQHKDAKLFCVQYCESSNAILHPVPEILKAVSETNPEILRIVDAISTVATIEIDCIKNGIDVLVGASQKAFMLPPGLSMLSLSKRAWEVVESNPVKSLYFNLKIEKKWHDKGTTAWTPAMNIILGLSEAFKMFNEEGIEEVYKRHKLASLAARAGMKALGLKTIADNHPPTGVTAAYSPDGMDAEKLRAQMLKKCGVRIAGGQDELQGKIIRIGHMGAINYLDVTIALSALELSLIDLGHNVKLGSATEAALKAVGKV